MKAVVADTSNFIALLAETDAYHEAAGAWTQDTLGLTVVTEYVLEELGGALCRSRYRGQFVPFVAHLLRDQATAFVPASSVLFQSGLKLYADRPDKTWSLVDC